MWRTGLNLNIYLRTTELRLIRDSLPCLGIVESDSGERLVMRDGTELMIPKSVRKEDITLDTFSHKYYDAADKV